VTDSRRETQTVRSGVDFYNGAFYDVLGRRYYVGLTLQF
jgi:hypothetical protein